MNFFIVLLIICGIIGIIATYVVTAFRCVDILDIMGCEGSFLEWFVCYCPLLHLYIYYRYRHVGKYNTLANQFKTMKNKFDKYKN